MLVLKLVRKARGRLFVNNLLCEGANALSAALLAFILLLVLGSQVLSWYWVITIPVCAAAAGLIRALKRRPSQYAAAQAVDHRLVLADTLSTAFYFNEIDPSAGSPEARRCQLEAANRLSQSLDIRRAIPYALPRTAYLVAGLFLVASSLFALRYAVSRRLDLKQPLARILQLDLGLHSRTEEAKNTPQALPPAGPPEQEAALPDESDRSRKDLPKASGRNTPNSTAKPEEKKEAASGGKKDSASAGQDGEEAEGSDQQAQSEPAAGPSDRDSGQNGSGAKARPEARQQQNGSGEGAGLMDRVKDAVQNLLSRIKPQSGESARQASAAAQQKGSQGKGQQDGARQQASGKGSQNGRQPGDSQQGDADRMTPDSQGAQGSGLGKSDSDQASKEPGSGIGSEDGDKAIRQAEQLAAMGKISEILGKRAANITGQATIQVQSSANQQLRTPYAQRNAEHSEGGAEIGRDEVPVALQSYVEQYFEQVRKQKKQ